MDKSKYKHLACPVCGELPRIRALYDDGDRRPKRRADDWNEYKVSCPHHHIDCCDWKETKLDAWREWLKRRKDTTQPDFWFRSNAAMIQNMGVDDLAGLLDQWRRDCHTVMCKDAKTGCAINCAHNEECHKPGKYFVTIESIKRWLQKPASGEYPKGYPLKENPTQPTR